MSRLLFKKDKRKVVFDPTQIVDVARVKERFVLIRSHRWDILTVAAENGEERENAGLISA